MINGAASFEGILQRLGVPVEIVQGVWTSWQQAWFTIQYSDNVSEYKRVVLPGDPASDVLFSCIILSCLNIVEQRLHDAQLTPRTTKAAKYPACKLSRAAGASIVVQVGSSKADMASIYVCTGLTARWSVAARGASRSSGSASKKKSCFRFGHERSLRRQASQQLGICHVAYNSDDSCVLGEEDSSDSTVRCWVIC